MLFAGLCIRLKQMLVPFAKFVVFTLVPALMMICCTTPDLWGRILHSFHHVGANSDQFLHIFGNIPGQAQDILTTSENAVRSLTCDDLEFVTTDISLSVSPGLSSPLPLSSEAPVGQQRPYQHFVNMATVNSKL
ncbi:hypothetical protein DSO57_1024375 [Entomophthora muscae]|uniref:Uncharacterized protein n=1 Tax=Entomophthora muscae TaxID=34485 RepID=A0ACC2RTJ7_9FUNG|nr:hypothetical protein DSO57_1024375 [Entomophthora muscae]